MLLMRTSSSLDTNTAADQAESEAGDAADSAIPADVDAMKLILTLLMLTFKLL